MKKILIVDDEENVTRVLKMSLEKTGEFAVRTENRGANSLAATREFRPDLILLDVMMPDIDGGEVAQQIKVDENIKDTPIIFLTAAVTKEELGAQGSIISGHPFIAKPVSVEELIRLIKKHVK